MNDNPVRSNRDARTRAQAQGRSATAVVTTLITVVILVMLSALVYHYTSHARPQVDTTAQSVVGVTSGTGNTASST